jgi:hypothetical protein
LKWKKDHEIGKQENHSLQENKHGASEGEDNEPRKGRIGE